MLCFFVVWLAVESVEARIDTPGKSKMEPENGPKTSFLHQPAVFRFHVGFFQRVDQAFMFIQSLFGQTPDTIRIHILERFCAQRWCGSLVCLVGHCGSLVHKTIEGFVEGFASGRFRLFLNELQGGEKDPMQTFPLENQITDMGQTSQISGSRTKPWPRLRVVPGSRPTWRAWAWSFAG